MRHTILTLSLIFLIKWSAQAQSPTEAAVIKLSKEKNEWMIKKDIKSLDKMLHDNLKFIHSNGREENKESFLATVEGSDFKELRTREMEARAFNKNEVVIVTGKLFFKATGNNGTNEYDLIFTEVYTKYKKNWQLISRHASKL